MNPQSTVQTSDDLQQSAIREPIHLGRYDGGWPLAFSIEQQRLLSLFRTELRAVEHIGSTAIPGMPAKPIVDLLAGVDTMAVADALFERVLRNGYTTSRAYNEMLPDRRWFMRSVAASPAVRAVGSPIACLYDASLMPGVIPAQRHFPKSGA